MEIWHLWSRLRKNFRVSLHHRYGPTVSLETESFIHLIIKFINNSWRKKQRKLLPWRRFGYVILIIIKFGKLLLWIAQRIIDALRSYIKHSKKCFIRYPNTSKLVKKTRPRLVFSTHLSVFGYLMRRFSLCLRYYFRPVRVCPILGDCAMYRALKRWTMGIE